MLECHDLGLVWGAVIWEILRYDLIDSCIHVILCLLQLPDSPYLLWIPFYELHLASYIIHQLAALPSLMLIVGTFLTKAKFYQIHLGNRSYCKNWSGCVTSGGISWQQLSSTGQSLGICRRRTLCPFATPPSGPCLTPRSTPSVPAPWH